MASLEGLGRQRDALPSINNLDFEKYRLDKVDHNRYAMPSLSSIAKSTASSPPTSYSGPPPPYSSAVSVNNSSQGVSGYVSPPESNSRRSTRDDKESPLGTTSLPSISEALKSADVTSSSRSYAPSSAPNSAVGQTFTEAPRGPGNPFSQPVTPASALRPPLSSIPDPSPVKTVPPPPAPPDTRQPPSVNTLGSPSLPNAHHHRLSAPLPTANSQVDSPFRSSYGPESARPGYPFPDYPTLHNSILPPSSGTFHFEQHGKVDHSRNPFAKPEPSPYNETVKRHLEIYDAELALNEITEASLQTLEFSKLWSQRFHQSNRTSYFTDGLPGTTDIDEMIRCSHHVLENLSRLREVAIMQQNALNEQRARAERGQPSDDDFHRVSEDYRSGGFAGGDAKKRRGKAAPPGRCHSCNRAETPEWRRGPDGARTLCNACGLHYAKLTRKIGANKAAVMTGSNLRPKSLNDTRP